MAVTWTELDPFDGLDAQAAWDLCAERGWSDGLPVLPPTRARVETFLGARGLTGGEAVGRIGLGLAPATSLDVAVNAVLAGCVPEAYPVLAAAAHALAEPRLNALGALTTTGSAAPCLLVHGPAAERCGINAGANCLGPGSRGNATVGRALSLLLRNAGGMVPGRTDMATMGQPGKYAFCFAENAAASPWPPLPTERGLPPGSGAVTLLMAAGTLEVVDGTSRSVEGPLRTMALAVATAGSVHAGEQERVGGGEALVVLPPEWAARLAAEGWDRERVRSFLCEHARLPVDVLPPEVASALRERRAARGADPGAPLAALASPDDVVLVVAGGVGVKATLIPTWGGGTRSVTVAVEP